MTTMSRYCKAYRLEELRKFSEWSEPSPRVRPGDEAEPASSAPQELTDDSVVYLHDTFIVTEDVFADEHVLFDSVTPAWREYCRSSLAFAPEDVIGAST